MEELLGRDLLAKTKRALEANEWNAVVGLWQPWIDAGDAEAEYQLAYHYLRCTPRDDDATCDRMEELLRSAAAKGHPDAVWFLATRGEGFRERSSDFDQELLRAGQLGSILAQRALGVMYATGEWSAPKDLARLHGGIGWPPNEAKRSLSTISALCCCLAREGPRISKKV